MKKLLKHLSNRTIRPLVAFYLKKERSYRFQGLRLKVLPGVFHPGLFYSTRHLLQAVSGQDLRGKNILELGAGSGLLALHCARRGGLVTASDISLTAIQNLKLNAHANGLALRIVESDLFRNLPARTFDFILINPPFYRKNPQSDAERAWYCGEKGEYFQELFQQLGVYRHSACQVLMVLSSDCDLELIMQQARQHQFALRELSRQKHWLETTYVFGICAA